MHIPNIIKKEKTDIIRTEYLNLLNFNINTELFYKDYKIICIEYIDQDKSKPYWDIVKKVCNFLEDMPYILSSYTYSRCVYLLLSREQDIKDTKLVFYESQEAYKIHCPKQLCGLKLMCEYEITKDDEDSVIYNLLLRYLKCFQDEDMSCIHNIDGKCYIYTPNKEAEAENSILLQNITIRKYNIDEDIEYHKLCRSQLIYSKIDKNEKTKKHKYVIIPGSENYVKMESYNKDKHKDMEDYIYINKSHNSYIKHTITAVDLDLRNMSITKENMYYKLIQSFNNRFRKYCTLNLLPQTVYTKKILNSGTIKEGLQKPMANNHTANRLYLIRTLENINLVDTIGLCDRNLDDYSDLVEQGKEILTINTLKLYIETILDKEITVSKEIDESKMNLVLIHDEMYFKMIDKKIDERNSHLINNKLKTENIKDNKKTALNLQSITVENLEYKTGIIKSSIMPMFITCLCELYIKNCLINKFIKNEKNTCDFSHEMNFHIIVSI